MRNKRRTFSASFKAKVAIEAIKEQSTIQDLASKYKPHANQISKWKAEFLVNTSSVFEKALIQDKKRASYVLEEIQKPQAAARFSAASRGLGSPNIYLSQKSSQKHHSINAGATQILVLNRSLWSTPVKYNTQSFIPDF